MIDPPIEPPGIDEEWLLLWHQAHAEMAIFDRVPSPHLIERIRDKPRRTWLRHHFGGLAEATLRHDEIMQPNGRLMFVAVLPDFATMRAVRTAVILEPPNTIWTAYQL